MDFTEGELYHIYNRGNNKMPVFFNANNYIYFLEKVKKYVVPNCDLLSYCLMPNHFHFEVYANQITATLIKIGAMETNPLSEGFRKLLSSYTKGINIQEDRTGSLFQQNTKAKELITSDLNIEITCFHYIHQNPLKAGLVTKMEDWPYSSFRDYIGLRKGTLCNQGLAIQLLDLDLSRLYKESYEVIDHGMRKLLFRC